MTQNQQTVQCEVLTDSGHSVEGNGGHSETELQAGLCEVLTDIGQTVEGNSGHSDTEPTDGTV